MRRVLHSRYHCVISAAGGVAVIGCGCSSGVEHNLAKVGVEGSNPFARSKFPYGNQSVMRRPPQGGLSLFRSGVHMVSTATHMRTPTPRCLAHRPAVSRWLGAVPTTPQRTPNLPPNRMTDQKPRPAGNDMIFDVPRLAR